MSVQGLTNCPPIWDRSHPLRSYGRTRSFVRELLGYYGPVRLPVSVHHRRILSVLDADLGAIRLLSPEVGYGISRFPRKMLVYAHGFFDRARSGCSSR